MSDWDKVGSLHSAGKWDVVGSLERVQQTAMDKDTERALKLGIEGQDLFDFFNPPSAVDGGPYERYMAGVGQTLTNRGAGIVQTLAHILPGLSTKKIDEFVNEELRVQESGGLNDDPYAKIGNFAMEGGAWAMGGGPLTKMGPVAAGLTEAGIETATQPVPGDFWPGKAKQGAINTAIGVGANKGIDLGMDVYKAGRNLPNAAMDYMERPAKGEPMIRADPAQLAEGNRLADATGIQMTMGERGQAPGLQQLESMAGESILTRGKVRAGNEIRQKQLEDAINSYADSLGPNVPKETLAVKIQAFVNDEANRLYDIRSNQAKADYYPVQSYNGGQPSIRADNYEKALEDIIYKGTTAGASDDMLRAAGDAKKRLKAFRDQGNLLTGQDVDLITRSQQKEYGGTVFDVRDPQYHDRLTSELNAAVLKDIEPHEFLKNALEKAKANYAANSRSIEGLEQTGLGKVVGEEVAADLINLKYNKIPPEKVFDKLWKLEPSELSVSLGYLDQNAPNISNEMRSRFLRDAIEQSKVAPATGGLRETPDPGGFLRAMGVRGSESGRVVNMDRVDRLFKDTPVYDQIKDVLEVTRRMADSRMANRSGTDIRAETRSLMESVTSAMTLALAGLKKGAGNVAMLTGMRGIADRMDPMSASFLGGSPRYTQNPLVRSRMTTLPAIPGLIAAGQMEDQ